MRKTRKVVAVVVFLLVMGVLLYGIAVFAYFFSSLSDFYLVTLMVLLSAAYSIAVAAKRWIDPHKGGAS
jgi:hypothetical protein